MWRAIRLSVAGVISALWLFSSVVAAQSGDVLRNGGFEGPFVNGVSEGWAAFNNCGSIVFRYADDTGTATVYEGAHSQYVQMHTRSVGGSQPDRQTGVYQVADVVPGTEYLFNIYGLLRSSEGNAEQSQWNYVVEVGFDERGGTDPWKVSRWVQVPWTQHPLEAPAEFEAFSQPVVATSGRLTVFVRLTKKFPTVGQEAALSLDAASLLGPSANDALSGVTMLPQTGLGGAELLAGAAASLLALGLTARRLRRHSR
jgi:hypothetical protein